LSIKSNILLRTRIAFLFCILFSLAVLGRVGYIQYIQGNKWREKAEKMTLRFMKIPATRGNIFASDGSLLATSLPFFKLAMDPKAPHDTTFNNGIDSLAILLSQHYGDLSPIEYKRKIKNARLEKGEKYLIINSSTFDFQTKKKMTKWPIFRAGRYKGGAIFEKIDRRFRPFGDILAVRTIGYLTEEKFGAGLEYSFRKILGGQNGEALFRKMAGGNWKPIHNDNEILPEQGLDILTTIDVNLQDVAESSLEKHLKIHDAEYGCVMLMEVATGEIKAIANLGKIQDGTYRETYNFAIAQQGLTDPGSTFKLATLVALFEDANIDLTDSVETGFGSGYKIYDRILYDAKPEGFGKISVKDVFAKSSNIGVAKLVQKYFEKTPYKFLEYIHEFGLDNTINFQMAGEAVPYVKRPSDKTWSGITLPWMSIGYELKLSPLHTLTFYNAIANEGKMIQPIIVKQVLKADRTIEEYESKILNKKVCSDKTLKKVYEMMEAVVEEGTAKNIKTSEYKISGKTGTAQIFKNGAYTKKYYTSFCGFFPSTKPKYSCIVVISDPKGFNQMGSDVSAPVFKEISDKIYAQDPIMHKQLPITDQPKLFDFPTVKSGYTQDLTYLCNELGVSNHAVNESSDWVTADLSNNSITWREKKVIQNLVPDVTGLTIKDALYLLENKNLNVNYLGAGKVYSQSIPPGRKIVYGNTIFLRLK
jgi:cell division protein FtsI (penicillin-binding protein 3)